MTHVDALRLTIALFDLVDTVHKTSGVHGDISQHTVLARKSGTVRMQYKIRIFSTFYRNRKKGQNILNLVYSNAYYTYMNSPNVPSQMNC